MSKKTLTPKLIKDAQKENPFAKLGEIVYQILETQITVTRPRQQASHQFNS